MRIKIIQIAVLTAALVCFTGGALRAQASQTAVVNHFVSDPKQNTVLYITDFDGTAPDVTVYFYSNLGDIIGSKKLSIPRNSTIPLRPHDVVKREEPMPDGTDLPRGLPDEADVSDSVAAPPDEAISEQASREEVSLATADTPLRKPLVLTASMGDLPPRS